MAMTVDALEGNVSDDNPFAPPETPLTTPETEPDSSDRATRKELLKHEANIKSVGFIWLLGAVFMVPTGLASLAAAFAVRAGDSFAIVLGVGVFYLLFGLAAGWCGYNLRKLERRARTPGILLALPGIIGIPIGTLISIFIIYLLASEKGRRVLSPEYQEIVRNTPDIRYRTNPIVLAIAVLLILGAIAALVIPSLMDG